MPLHGTCAHDAENKETFKEWAWGPREWCIPSLAAGPGAPMASDGLRFREAMHSCLSDRMSHGLLRSSRRPGFRPPIGDALFNIKNVMK